MLSRYQKIENQSPPLFLKRGQVSPISEKGYHDIFKLRELHVQMDNAVLSAYGWTDITLAHDFYEVDYLPENDRTRFTISPDARKEILKRLLELNHKIHEEEVKAAALKPKAVKGASKKGKREEPENQTTLSL